MKDSTPEVNPVDEAIADAAANPANPDDAAPIVLTKAEKAARRKADNETKKLQREKDKKAADALKKKEANAKKKLAADAKALTVVQKGAMTLINAGLKAMEAVGKGNLMWTVSAHKLRILCEGTSVKFGAEAEKYWGVRANTATKLANAGRLLFSITEEGGDMEWMAYMPMSNVNNMSTIAGMSDVKIALGIDTDVIKIDATEAEINDFNRDFDDKGKPVIVQPQRDIPGTPAAEAEAEAAISESDKVAETPAQLMARLADAATDLKPAQLIQLIATMAGNLKGKRVEDLFTALEVVHPAPK